jgi:hypothetical protein
MELTVLEAPGTEWDEFATRYTDLIFYRSAWSEVLRKGLGGQPLYFCLREGRKIVAGLPGVLLNFKIFRVLYASIPYGNMIGEKERFPDLWEYLEGEFIRRRIHQVRIADSPFWESRNPTQNFKGIETICTLIDLKGMDEESLLKSYSHYVRRDLKRAQKNGIEIYKGESKEDFDHLYRLYLMAMKRNRAPAKYSYRLVMAFREFMLAFNGGTLLIARKDESPVAGMLLMHSNSSTHAFLTGSDSRFLKFYPNKLLVHQSLVEAISCGHEIFDFMGSEKGDANLIRFKNLWGGRSVPVTTYVKDYDLLRGWIWNGMRSFMNTKVGAGLTRAVRNRILHAGEEDEE